MYKTMKRKYLTPTITITLMAQCLPIADSTITINADETVNAADIETKSSTSYNVWSDDWSE